MIKPLSFWQADASDGVALAALAFLFLVLVVVLP